MSEATDIGFSDWTVLGYCIRGLVYFAVPVLAWLWLRRYQAAHIFPLIAGIITYFLSTKLCDLTVWAALRSMPMGVKVAAAAELVGFFEETGRWIAMKYPLSDVRTAGAAVSYGIGHAGLECCIRGVQSFLIAGYGQRFQQSGLEFFTRDASAERAAEIAQQLQSYAENSFGLSMLGSVNVLTNFGVHIALSLLIYRKMETYHFKRRWLLTAIVLHTALNELAGVTGILLGSAASDIVSIGVGTGIFVLVMKLIDGRTVLDDIRYPMPDE